MRTIISFFIISLLSLGLICNEAQAKRFGGGRSFGMQRSMSSFSSSAAKQSSGLMGKNTNKWGGMLGGLFGGLLIGGLLTSLFMGNGIATGLITWLVLAALILFLINLFRRRMQPSMQAANNHNYQQDPLQSFKNNFSDKFQQFTDNHGRRPYSSGFIAEDFLREAKVKFIRLQAAYDQQNLADIKEFTSPEVLAEIQMQFQEQEGALNQTEVVSLDAELLNVETQSNIEIASVRFTGLIKENSGTPEALNEIWHFQKAKLDDKWIVSGVQQVKPL